MQSILDFIKVFNSPSNEILFTECACYWFSVILQNRFPNSTIVYNPDIVHFATRIGSKIYDIRGLVEDAEDYVEWGEYKLHADDAEMIQCHCILLEGK